jgi:hypothetical protein
MEGDFPMTNLDGSSWALLAVASYLAAACLSRLMKQRYDTLIARLRREWREEQQKQFEEEQLRRRENRKRRLRENLQKPVDPSSERAA